MIQLWGKGKVFTTIILSFDVKLYVEQLQC